MEKEGTRACFTSTAMSDHDMQSSQPEASSSGRSQRTRRPAKRFGDTVSWHEASQRTASGSRPHRRASRAQGDAGGEEGDDAADEDDDMRDIVDEDEDDGLGVLGSASDEDGYSEEMSDSEDEYRPDDDDDEDAPKTRGKESRRAHDHRSAKNGAVPQVPDNEGSDDGVSLDEEYDEEGSDEDQIEGEEEEVEGPQDQDTYEDVPEERLRGLVDAYSALESGASQGDQWTSAMTMAEDAEEELDDEEFMDDVRGAMGFRRSRKRVGQQAPKRRQPRQIVLSDEVKTLLADANSLFVNGKSSEAKRLYQEIVRIDNKVRSAWGNLALIHEEDGNADQAMHCRIIAATLTPNSADTWKNLAIQSWDMGHKHQAVICSRNAVNEALKSKRTDSWNLMWELAIYLEESKDDRGAANMYRRMLKYFPHNAEVLSYLTGCYFRLKNLDRAIDTLEETREWNEKMFPRANHNDEVKELSSKRSDLTPTWDESLLATLVDLYLRTDQPNKAVDTIRSGMRWLQFRAEETFWDQLDDDREYDESRDERDLDDGQYSRLIEQADIHELPGSLRLFLGIARSRLDDTREAWRHLDLWYADKSALDTLEDDHENAGFFIDEALALAERARADPTLVDAPLKDILEAATNMGELLYTGVPQESELYIDSRIRLAKCFYASGDLDSAIIYYDEAVDLGPGIVPNLLRLAELYEERQATGDSDRAMYLIGQMARVRREELAASQRARADPVGEPSSQFSATQESAFFVDLDRDTRTSSSVASERERRKVQEENMVQEAIARYRRLDLYQGLVFAPGWWSHDFELDGNPDDMVFGFTETKEERGRRFVAVRQWLIEADRLVNMFCNTPQLYPSDRLKKFKGVIRTHQRRSEHQIESQMEAIMLRLNRAGTPPDIGLESSDFRGIDLDEWASLLVEYALVLTKLGEYKDAMQILSQATKSSIIYANWERRKLIHLCEISCALYSFKNLEAIDTAKVFMNEYAFHAEPLRVALTLVNSMGSVASYGILNQQRSAKMFLRRERLFETVIRGMDVKFNTSTRRWVDLRRNKTDDADSSEDDRRAGKGRSKQRNRDDDDSGDEADGELRKGGRSAHSQWPTVQLKKGVESVKHKPPTKANPSNTMFYAGTLLASNNGIPSMAYWLRAFAQEQNDPLICLTAAVACLGRATNRQVDNRNHVVLQAYALMQKYRELRQSQMLIARAGAEPKETDITIEVSLSGVRHKAHNGKLAPKQPVEDAPLIIPEVDYNFGRVAHHMALYSLAVPHYQAVLRAWDKAQDEIAIAGHASAGQLTPGFDAMGEAAFNLHLIYLSMGNTSLANHIMERYLVV